MKGALQNFRTDSMGFATESIRKRSEAIGIHCKIASGGCSSKSLK